MRLFDYRIRGHHVWLVCLLFFAAAAAIAFVHFDVALARYFSSFLGRMNGLAAGLGSAVLLSGEAAVALTLIISRITRGRISPFSEALALACLSSICAYAINAGVLKVLFGVPNPAEVLLGARHGFHFLQGTQNSSFPSGHMVLAGAFAGVFMRLYRSSVLPLAALLCLAAALLIVGDWHFLSDVLAGAFAGVSAGLLAGEVWIVHRDRRAAPPE